jgi:diaminobutyrate-2-oxoglutarate transaminase
MHALDMYTAPSMISSTVSREDPQARGFDYKIQFTGPTGTNAVEAALKLARKVKSAAAFSPSWARSTA